MAEPAPAPAPTSEAKPSGRRRVMGLGGGVVGGILGYFLVRTVVASGWFFGSTVPLEVLTKTASQLNKMLPIKIDRHTELVTTIAMPGTLVYQYRLTGVSADGMTGAGLAEIERIQRHQVSNLACSTRETRENLLNRGVTMRYQYADSQGRQVMRIDVKSSDCKR